MLDAEVVVSHDALDLVELSQVRRVQRLVTEHAVYAEVLGGSEPILQ